MFSTASLKFLENLPNEFIKVSKTNHLINFTTKEFEKIDQRIKDSVKTINDLTQR